jgi:hypothetical protein
MDKTTTESAVMQGTSTTYIQSTTLINKFCFTPANRNTFLIDLPVIQTHGQYREFPHRAVCLSPNEAKLREVGS